jgi:hypothetical protein
MIEIKVFEYRREKRVEDPSGVEDGGEDEGRAEV